MAKRLMIEHCHLHHVKAYIILYPFQKKLKIWHDNPFPLIIRFKSLCLSRTNQTTNQPNVSCVSSFFTFSGHIFSEVLIFWIPEKKQKSFFGISFEILIQWQRRSLDICNLSRQIYYKQYKQLLGILGPDFLKCVLFYCASWEGSGIRNFQISVISVI